MTRGVCLALAANIAFSFPGVLHAQALPERQSIGSLQLVASFAQDQPAAVAVSRSGRLFVSFPRHYGPVAMTLGEVKDRHTTAYPDAASNHPAPEHVADGLFSIQAMEIDASDRLWLLDSGLPKDGEAPVPNTPKLVVVDLSHDAITRAVPIPPAALVPNSALKDVRIDPRHGPGGTAYITDSAPGAEAFIVLDLASGSAVRRLEGAWAMKGLVGAVPLVGYQPLLTWPARAAPRPFSGGLNGLALSADGRTLFFCAFTGRRLWSVSTDALADRTLDDARLRGQVKDMGEIGIAGHLVVDGNDRLYIMNMEQNAIYRRAPDGRTGAVVADPALEWPDSMAIGTDQYLYVTASQHDRGPFFHDGQDLRERPFALFRTFVGADPGND